MSETEFRKLAIKVDLQQRVIAELCRRLFVSDELARIFDSAERVMVPGRSQERVEAVNEAMLEFRRELLKPNMGRDDC